jgi:hypothetical protein
LASRVVFAGGQDARNQRLSCDTRASSGHTCPSRDKLAGRPFFYAQGSCCERMSRLRLGHLTALRLECSAALQKSQSKTTSVICQPARLILTAQGEAEATLGGTLGFGITQNFFGPAGTVRLCQPLRYCPSNRLLVAATARCAQLGLTRERSRQDRRFLFRSPTQGCGEAMPHLHPGLGESALQAGCWRPSKTRWCSFHASTFGQQSRTISLRERMSRMRQERGRGARDFAV